MTEFSSLRVTGTNNPQKQASVNWANSVISALENKGGISVKSFGAEGDGATDDTTAIQDAIDHVAALGGGSVFFPRGTYIVSATIDCASGVRICGEGRQSIIRPTITDGSAVLSFPASSQFWSVEDIGIASSVVQATYLAGGAAQNCTGIKGNSYSNRFYLKNVHIFGLAKGCDLTGYIATADNLWIECCDVGLTGSELNSADLNLRMENNKKAFALTYSKAVLFRQLLDEGGHSAPLAATLDQCAGVEFIAPYWEQSVSQPRANPYLAIGLTTECQQISIRGCNLVDYLTAATPAIDVDRCDGLSVEGYSSRGQYGLLVRTTANTKDYRSNLWSNVALNASPWIQDGSKQLGACFNYFPNRNFDLWFRGWHDVVLSGCVLTRETTVVRKGANAVRLTAGSGSSFNYGSWEIQGAAVTALRGKSIRVGAWVWVADVTEYANNSGTRTALPSILVRSHNGSANSDSSTRNARATAGAWNFMWGEVSVQSDATSIQVRVYLNQSATATTGNEYIMVDSIIISEATTPMERMVNDDLVDSPMIMAGGLGGKLRQSGTAAPTDATQVYEVGDIVMNSAPAAGETEGWVCTTAGSPGTWKAFGTIAA